MRVTEGLHRMSVIINPTTHPQRGRDSLGKKEKSAKSQGNKQEGEEIQDEALSFSFTSPPPLSNYNSCCATGEFKMLEHNLKWISLPTHFIQDRKSLEGSILKLSS